MSIPARAPTNDAAGRPLYAALCAGSFAGVYLQVSLMKLTSVMYYSIFVYTMIGVALLGYGAAGSVLAARRTPPRLHPALALGRWLTAFALVAVPSFLAVNAIELPASVLFGALRGVPALLLTYALLTLPFFLLGLGIAGAFTAYAADANRLYFADLIGAGAGSALAIATLPWLGGVPLVAAAGVVGAVGAGLAFGVAGASRRPALVVGALDLAVLVVTLTIFPLEVRVAADKHGPIVARAAGATHLDFARWSRFGRVDVTESFATLPPQFGGDVSPRFAGRTIEQRMLTYDGAAPAFLYRVDGTPADLDFLAGTSQSPAYRLRPTPSVLVIGVGGATDVLIALSQGARRVVGVELNPATVQAVRDVFGPYVGDVLRDPRVQVVVAEGRNFAARDQEQYDVVQLSGVDTGAAHGAFGLATSPESYVYYTVEAMHDLLARLRPGGVLSITRDLSFGWALRLVGIVREALLAEGLDPGPRIAVLKGLGYGWATLLVKRDPFTAAEATALRDFDERWQFPLLYDPLTGAGDAAFARAVREGPAPQGDLDLRPTTDDWPFFFLSFRWRSVSRAFAADASPLLKPIAFLLVNLAGLALLALVLIGWPLWRLRDAWRATRGKTTIAGYFAALGAGFILIEIALMQRFTVFLGDPALAVATVLAALLVSSGIGSWAARSGRLTVGHATLWIVVVLAFFASPLAPALLRTLLPASLPVRLGCCVLLVALAGVPMGMPFPMGLTRLAARSGPFVPWAWGINAMLSVVSSLASYLVGMAAGYTAMFGGGIVLYVAAFWFSRRL